MGRLVNNNTKITDRDSFLDLSAATVNNLDSDLRQDKQRRPDAFRGPEAAVAYHPDTLSRRIASGTPVESL